MNFDNYKDGSLCPTTAGAGYPRVVLFPGNARPFDRVVVDLLEPTSQMVSSDTLLTARTTDGKLYEVASDYVEGIDITTLSPSDYEMYMTNQEEVRSHVRKLRDEWLTIVDKRSKWIEDIKNGLDHDCDTLFKNRIYAVRWFKVR